MTEWSATVWGLVGVIAATAVLGCLHVLGKYYEHQTMLHDLRVRCTVLRKQYEERMQEMRDGEVQLVDEDAPASKAA